MGESLWEFESPLRHHFTSRDPPRHRGTPESIRSEGSPLSEHPVSRDIDLAVLTHLRGYPEELRRFSNLIKQAHPHGRTAAEFFLSRPVADGSFVAALCRLVESGEDIVTVVEAAGLLGVPPSALLDPARTADLPTPLSGDGRYRLWRRTDVAARRSAWVGRGTGG